MKLSTIVRATVIAASASLVLGACTAGPGTAQSGTSSQGASDVTIGLTYIPNVQFAPVYVADSQGLYNDAGVAATVRHHGSDEGKEDDRCRDGERTAGLVPNCHDLLSDTGGTRSTADARMRLMHSSHPDFNRRCRNFTGSTALVL